MDQLLEVLVGYEDVGADLDFVVDLENVVAAHADAAVAAGVAQGGFLGGAVDVDASLVGVIGAEEALEPDDAGDDGVAAAGVGGDDFAGRRAVLDDGALGEVIADLVVNPEEAERCFVTVKLVADPETGGGDDEGAGGFAFLEDGELLVRNGDDDLGAEVEGAGGEGEEGDK